MEKEGVHAVFITALAMGHLKPMVELAKRILNLPTTTTRHSLTITIITIPLLGSTPELSSIISSCPVPNLSFLQLEPIKPPPSMALSFQAIASVVMDLYKPVVKSTIEILLSSAPITAVVASFFCSTMIDVAIELGISPYVFFPIGAAQLALLLHMWRIDPLIPDDKKAIEMQEEVTIPLPGFSSKLPISALPDALIHGKDEVYHWFNQHGQRFKKTKGILINTFDELLPNVLEALHSPNHPIPPVHPVGPLLSLKAEPYHKCITWLDQQPRGSVVFLCFGSMGSFPVTQVKEIAIALERSGHRFLWVLRAQSKPEQGRFNGPTDAVLDKVLPDRFLERTKGRGLVWPSSVPQAEILGHVAVGGFVSHCGWNSCSESLWFGVPMAAWPLYAEQHFNAYVMVEEMGVAVAVKTDRLGGNSATAEEVERAVRSLMGEESAAVREKVNEAREKARRAVEEGGSSFRNVERAASEWMGGVGTL